MGSTSLHTDRYELTMLDAAIGDGTAQRPATFEAFYRRTPNGLDHVVMAGANRITSAVENFRFGPDEIRYLTEESFLTPATLNWLKTFRFTGTLTVAADGTRLAPNTPAVTVDGTFAECVILETIILSILNADVTIASHAAAMRAAAGPDATLIEMGSRRTHDAHAVDAAVAAYIGGFDATSNLEAGRRHGIPTTGTAAHAWTLAHTGLTGEIDAFRAQIAAHGVGTTLLVDTYDTTLGVHHAVIAANEAGAAGPGAIRIDSGDLVHETIDARRLLDSLGATDTRIVVSGDLDADEIGRLRSSGAPVDGYGIGTNLVAARPLGFVYKLVAITDPAGAVVPVAKRSATPGKATVGGRKTVVADLDGTLVVGDGTDARTTVVLNGNSTRLPLPAAADARQNVIDRLFTKVPA